MIFACAFWRNKNVGNVNCRSATLFEPTGLLLLLLLLLRPTAPPPPPPPPRLGEGRESRDAPIMTSAPIMMSVLSAVAPNSNLYGQKRVELGQLMFGPNLNFEEN